MAYYYVDSGGTRTASGGVTKQTGTYPTGIDAYPSLADFASDALAFGDGDFLVLADDFTAASTSTVLQLFSMMSAGETAYVVSVDATACEDYKAGAIIFNATSSYFLQEADTTISYHGVTFQSSGTSSVGYYRPNGGCHALFYDCTIKDTVSGADSETRFIDMEQDGAHVQCYETTFDTTITNLSRLVNIRNNGIFEAYYCNVVESGSGAVSRFVGLENTGGGSHVRIVGGDYTALSSALVWLEYEADSTTVDIWAAEIASGVDPFDISTYSGVLGSAEEFRAVACDDTDEESYALWRPEVEVDKVATPHTGDSYSWQVNTTTLCTKGRPAVVDLVPTYKDLSASASDVIRCHLATASGTLDVSQVALFVAFTKTSDAVLQNVLSTNAGNLTTWQDPMDTSTTELTTTTSEWTGTTANEYKLEIDLSAESPEDTPTGVHRVWLEVYDDVTFIVDPFVAYV